MSTKKKQKKLESASVSNEEDDFPESTQYFPNGRTSHSNKNNKFAKYIALLLLLGLLAFLFVTQAFSSSKQISVNEFQTIKKPQSESNQSSPKGQDQLKESKESPNKQNQQNKSNQQSQPKESNQSQNQPKDQKKAQKQPSTTTATTTITATKFKQLPNKDIEPATSINANPVEDFPEFQEQYENLLKSVKFKTLTHQKKQNEKEYKTQKMKYQYFESEENIKNFLDTIEWNKSGNKDNNPQLYLSAYLHWFPYDKKFLEAEYYYFDQKYKIGSFQKELPICLFSTGYKLFTKKQFKEYFRSVERQNYTNYKVITVDDSSPDGSAAEYFKFIEAETPRLSQRSTIVVNQKNIKALANRKIYVPLFCEKGSIVIDLDTDDSLIGSQVFQVYNAMYQTNPQLWYVYGNYMRQPQIQQAPVGGMSKSLTKLQIPISQYRTHDGWFTSHLKSYRPQLLAKVPPEYLTQLKYDPATKEHKLIFHPSAYDRFQIYPMLELSGDQRVQYINEFFYFYIFEKEPKCYMLEERVEEYNARMKTPLMPLQNLDGIPKKTKNYNVPKQIMQTSQYFIEKYRKEC